MTHDYIWNYRINCYLYIHVFNTCIPKKVCSSDFYWTAQFFLPRSRTEDRSSSAEPNKRQLYSGPRSPVGSALSPPADTAVEKLAECLTVCFLLSRSFRPNFTAWHSCFSPIFDFSPTL